MKISSIAPLGALFVLLALFGCASPVTVNPRRNHTWWNNANRHHHRPVVVGSVGANGQG
ncbi:MAG: hypothetical protein WCG80_19390 [Spirochaetales bacterium]